MSELKDLLRQLVAFESISPEDAGCQEFMIAFFESHGFQCQRFNNPPVSNFFAQIGKGKPMLVFAGHTDVVPVGEASKWKTPPFSLSESGDILFGRGVADMKGSLAAMMVMAAEFAKNHSDLTGSLGFLITSGEEGDDYNQGTPYVMTELQKLGIHPDYCIVGEPSSTKTFGDVIKIGRRGSLNCHLKLHGKQGHVAYPHLAINPVHQITPALHELICKYWDHGNAHFPPTTFQITKIHAGGQASNIIPGELDLTFGFRYSTEQSAESLMDAVTECFERHGLNPELNWQLSGKPFLTAQGALLSATIKAIQETTGNSPELSTSGGTSDGRFIAPFGVEVIELGPVNATIHQVNEEVSLTDLEALSKVYLRIADELCKG